MRNALLALAALAIAAPAYAQTADSQPAYAQSGAPDTSAPPPDASPPDQPAPKPVHKMHHHHIMQTADDTGGGKWAHEPGTGESGPASSTASNITSNDTKSDIAPHLPMPMAGASADPNTYLAEAQRALARHKTGEAQQALEMAETRLLDRSTPASNTDYKSQDPAVAAVGRARQALGSGDVASARSAIQMAMSSAQAAPPSN